MKIGLLGAVAVATTVFADLHTVLTLKHLMESTIAYHESLTAFDGTYAKGISLWRKSGDLVNTLKAAGLIRMHLSTSDSLQRKTNNLSKKDSTSHTA